MHAVRCFFVIDVLPLQPLGVTQDTALVPLRDKGVGGRAAMGLVGETSGQSVPAAAAKRPAVVMCQ